MAQISGKMPFVVVFHPLQYLPKSPVGGLF